MLGINLNQPMNINRKSSFSKFFLLRVRVQGEEEEEEEDVPEDLADLEPEEQQKRIKPMPQKTHATKEASLSEITTRWMCFF